MKANELRIGNLVTPMTGERVHIMRVEYIGHNVGGPLIDEDYEEYLTHHWQELEYDQISPIPLTEEWLVRLGFEIEPLNLGVYDVKLNDFFTLEFQPQNQWNEEDGFHLYVNGTEYDSNVFIKYVHQLQNLYFALTGEELTIKYESRKQGE